MKVLTGSTGILTCSHHFLNRDFAWGIVTKTFAYTNHTVLPEALEKWPVELIGNLLPRHLEIIYEINWSWLQKVSQKYPSDMGKLERLSIVEEGPVKKIRMAYLVMIITNCIIGVVYRRFDGR